MHVISMEIHQAQSHFHFPYKYFKLDRPIIEYFVTTRLVMKTEFLKYYTLSNVNSPLKMKGKGAVLVIFAWNISRLTLLLLFWACTERPEGSEN